MLPHAEESISSVSLLVRQRHHVFNASIESVPNGNYSRICTQTEMFTLKPFYIFIWHILNNRYGQKCEKKMEKLEKKPQNIMKKLKQLWFSVTCCLLIGMYANPPVV